MILFAYILYLVLFDDEHQDLYDHRRCSHDKTMAELRV